jgi:peptidyl-prolyl cis-trans isomerase C
MGRGHILAASLLGLLICGGVRAADKPAAVVNGDPISMADVEAMLALRPAELFPIPEAQKRLIRHEILELLISERLMKQFLAKHAPPVEPAEINRQMAALTDALKAQGKTLPEFCKESRQTEAQIRSGLVTMLQFNGYARKLATEDELKKYFADNIDFFQKTTVRLSHIVMRVPAAAPATEREETRQRLLALRQKIVSGQITFADAAREYSQCPTAPKGGDIGLVRRKWDLDESVAKAAFALKKDEVSEVVESAYGLHLLKVTERLEGKKVEFITVIDDVRDNYVEEMRQKLVIDLRRKARIETNMP